MSASAPIIFVSSTCYDLTDLRAELAASLQKDGFTVKLSDVLESAFQVIPSATTIGSCLQNLLASDAALFIFDRFYGQCLGGEYGDKSATHVEFEAAVEHQMNMLHFVRQRTLDDFERWKADPGHFKARWVDQEQHEKLFRLIAQVRHLHNPEKRNNWCDPFDASPDLRVMARKRLYDIFPAYAGARALSRDRVVRLSFVRLSESGRSRPMTPLAVEIQNVGLGTARDIRVLLTRDQRQVDERCLPVLMDRDRSRRIQFTLDADVKSYRISCTYGNFWGDTYEISCPLEQRDPNSLYDLGPEQFRVVEAAD